MFLFYFSTCLAFFDKTNVLKQQYPLHLFMKRVLPEIFVFTLMVFG